MGLSVELDKEGRRGKGNDSGGHSNRLIQGKGAEIRKGKRDEVKGRERKREYGKKKRECREDEKQK